MQKILRFKSNVYQKCLGLVRKNHELALQFEIFNFYWTIIISYSILLIRWRTFNIVFCWKIPHQWLSFKTSGKRLEQPHSKSVEPEYLESLCRWKLLKLMMFVLTLMGGWLLRCWREGGWGNEIQEGMRKGEGNVEWEDWVRGGG